jgi:hypothetical protein
VNKPENREATPHPILKKVKAYHQPVEKSGKLHLASFSGVSFEFNLKSCLTRVDFG